MAAAGTSCGDGPGAGEMEEEDRASDCGGRGVMTATMRGSDGWPSTVVTCASDPDWLGAMACSRFAVRASSCLSCRFVSEISFIMS